MSIETISGIDTFLHLITKLPNRVLCESVLFHAYMIGCLLIAFLAWQSASGQYKPVIGRFLSSENYLAIHIQYLLLYNELNSTTRIGLTASICIEISDELFLFLRGKKYKQNMQESCCYGISELFHSMFQLCFIYTSIQPNPLMIYNV